VPQALRGEGLLECLLLRLARGVQVQARGVQVHARLQRFLGDLLQREEVGRAVATVEVVAVHVHGAWCAQGWSVVTAVLLLHLGVCRASECFVMWDVRET